MTKTLWYSDVTQDPSQRVKSKGSIDSNGTLKSFLHLFTIMIHPPAKVEKEHELDCERQRKKN